MKGFSSLQCVHTYDMSYRHTYVCMSTMHRSVAYLLGNADTTDEDRQDEAEHQHAKGIVRELPTHLRVRPFHSLPNIVHHAPHLTALTHAALPPHETSSLMPTSCHIVYLNPSMIVSMLTAPPPHCDHPACLTNTRSPLPYLTLLTAIPGNIAFVSPFRVPAWGTPRISTN